MAVTGWALIRGLLWPLARPALAQAAVLTFVLALNNFAVPAILQVKVLPAEMWVRFNTTFDTMGTLIMSWPCVAAPLLLLVWLSRREFPWPHVELPVSPGMFRQQLGLSWWQFAGVCTLTICVLAAGVPLAQLVALKRTWTELPGALAAGRSAVWNSLGFAAAAATTVTAFVLALNVPAKASKRVNFGFRLSDFLRISAFGFRILPWCFFLFPGVLLGITLIHFFNHSWSALFYQSAGIVILAFNLRYLAVGWTGIHRAVRITDFQLTDAARLDGASRWQLLRHVLWPQIAPQVACGWYIVFLLCLWDVESMILVVPPGGETLALRIFNLLHYGHNAQVNALCLALLVVAVLPLILSALRRALFGGRTDSRFTLHAPRFALIAACALLLTSCGKAPSHSTPLTSRIFSHVEIIGSRGVGVGELNKPRSVAVDSQDNLYAVDMTGRVQKFSPEGKYLLFWQMQQTDLGKPKGMCRDCFGNIVVVEPHYQRLNHFTTEGNLVARWGQRGTNEGQFIMPRAAAINSRGEVFVSEYGEVERVQKFMLSANSDGSPVSERRSTSNTLAARFLFSFGRPGTGPGEFNRPEGLCLDTQDRLYVADSCNHRIQVFSSGGKFLRAYGKPGTGKGELSYPYDICVDAKGWQYVCEFGNSRIQVFDANDQPIEIIGRPGGEPGQFNNPWGVALDSIGNLYVADSQNHRVQKLVRKIEAPNTKHQAPEKLQASSSRPTIAARLGAWCLVFLWCLELGAWCFPPMTEY
jgi:ABC-type spermidine/putrescine transport system permease subunit II/DNA-binding beta-propeller fold protein YncE